MHSKAAKEGEGLDLERPSERFGCKEVGGGSMTETTVGNGIPRLAQGVKARCSRHGPGIS